MVFEVVDSNNDKHIIEYEKDRLVLLDEIYNSVEYLKIDYTNLKTFADKNNMEVKELVYIANDLNEFENIFTDIKNKDYKYKEEYVEGFVIEDNSGFMFKYKTEYYKKWKLLRTRMENAIKNNDFKVKDNNEIEFMKFLESKYKDKIIDINTINIIDERNNFDK